MEVTFIVVGLIVLILGLIICLCTEARGLDFYFGVIGALLLSGGIMMYSESNKPAAMDVYQGKTTLKYTVKDGVAIDSVVVFKDEEK